MTSSVIVKKCAWVLFLGFLVLFGPVRAQTVNDYRSAGSGAWNNTSTWERFNGTSWVAAVSVPDASVNVITIQTGHTVNVPAGYSVSVDQFVISGTLQIINTGTVTIANGAGTDLTVSGGGLSVSGLLICSNGATLAGTTAANTTFFNGSRYRHMYTTTEGNIPLATWQSNSTLEIAGYTSFNSATAGGNWNQNFGNVIWNCASQGNTFFLNGLLTSVAGDLTVSSTGGGPFALSLSDNQNPTINVTGNFNIATGSRVSFSLTGGAPGATINIGGNLSLTSSNALGSYLTTTGVCNLNITGSLIVNSGALYMASGGSGRSNVVLRGDLNLSNGASITETGPSAQGNFDFAGAGLTHTLTNVPGSSTISGNINYVVDVSTTLIASGESRIAGSASSSLTVSGTLNVQSANANGAIQNGFVAGNVFVGPRTFNSGSTVVYGGSSPQAIGNGHPTNAGVITTISNPAGVTLNNTSLSTITLGGNLNVTSGSLMVQNNSLTVPGTTTLNGGSLNLITTSTVRTLTLSGNLVLTSGQVNVTSGTANANLVINGNIGGTDFITFVGTNNVLSIGGSGGLGRDFPLSAASPIKTITINRPGATVAFPQAISGGAMTVSNGNVDLNGSLLLTSDLNIAAGVTFFFEGNSVELQGKLNNTLSGGLFSSDATSSLKVSGIGNTFGTLAFKSGGNTLGSFELDRTASGSPIGLNSTLTIANSFTITRGNFTNTSGLTMSAGSTFLRRANGSLIGSIPLGGPYDLVYSGLTLGTGPESKGSLNNLTSNSVGTVILNNPISLAGDLTINSGAFTSGANPISAVNFVNHGTFNAPGSSLTLTGNFTNSDTYNNSSGSVIFNGNTSFSNTVDPTFYDVTISGIVNAPTLFNIAGNLTYNGTFNPGTKTVQFSGNATKSITGSPISFYNLTVSKSGGSSMNSSVGISVTNALSLINGTLSYGGTLTMSSGSTITRMTTGSISGSVPMGGPYHLTYVGGSCQSGVEAQGSLMDVGVNVSGTVTVNSNINTAGDFTITSGTVTFGSNTLSADNLVINGTFNAPSTQLTLTGDLTNNGVFSNNTGTTNFNGSSSILGTSGIVFGGIVISGTLAAPSLLELTGDFTDNGTFIVNSGTVCFRGNTVQNLTSTSTITFHNIVVGTVTNSYLRVESNENLEGTLTLNNSSTFDADGSSDASIFTLLSTNDRPFQDARVAALPSGASVIGNLTDQRYFGTADNVDRFFSAPVSTASIGQLQASVPVGNFPITGDFTGTSYPCAGCVNNGGNLWYYDETVQGAISKGYRGWPGKLGTSATTLVPGVGYDCYMWNGVAPTLTSMTGPINQGSLTFNVTHTTSSPPQPSADGWNLLGNPYPSAIIWDNGAGWTKNQIAPTISVWDASAHVYRTWNCDTSTGDLPNGVIATGQSFWVYANDATASLTINEQAKTATSGSFLRVAGSRLPALEISLTHNISTDNSFIFFDPTATNKFDPGRDAMKLLGAKEVMAIAPVDADNDVLAQDFISEFREDVPVLVEATEEGQYSIGFSTHGSFAGSEDLYLADLTAGKYQKITDGPYAFTLTKDDLGEIDHRFVLTMNPKSIVSGNNTLAIKPYPNPVTDELHISLNSDEPTTVEILDGMGNRLTVVTMTPENKNLSSGVVDMRSYHPGLYLVKVHTSKGVVIEKVIKR